MCRVLAKPFQQQMSTDETKMRAGIIGALQAISRCLCKDMPAQLQLAACEVGHHIR